MPLFVFQNFFKVTFLSMTPLYNMNTINSSLLVEVRLILIIYSVALGKAGKILCLRHLRCILLKCLVSSYLSLLIII